ncbi:cytochrome C peroxidase [Flavobacterium akiainvivens]|uniref:Cytochrome C peroxidase n=1 Tax=Flavobacterium akiainvivens TaxID=1202724 RepID=A0A0M8MIX3_9FLAO|nr:cytochrome c peroxidase [Flavobacterium akiainvivens]KOS06747.1 cytochrome C peroxidase [Flavobacterium akiainvivens]SFQ74367.1 cytochrome c peroxidase [Flavobacterium akiainvivens]
MVTKYAGKAAIVVSCVLIFIGLYSFSPDKNYTAISIIQQYALDFKNATETLDQTAVAFEKGTITVDSLQHVMGDTRLKYKKIEFYLAYHYPEYIKESINGAPLMQIEKEGTQPKVIPPVGLQVLDETVFSDNPAEQKNEISALAKRLRNNYLVLYTGLSANAIATSGNISAMRLQLVRIFSLGVTGFDTPGSLNGLEEAKASLEGMRTFFASEYTSSAHFNTNISLLDFGIDYLGTKNSFDDFDRLEFFKKCIDPLYKNLGLVENVPDENLAGTSSWNPKSQSIFGTDFLDPYFYSQLKPGEDSAELRNLGKSLFYDPLLSTGSTMSCATCHDPKKGFADGLPKSASSVQGKTVLRNAPTLLNAVYADRYFYDLRAFTLEQQAEHVIFNPEEFNTAYSSILKKLEDSPQYKQQFKKVFGKKGLTRENFSKALASYVLSLQSFNSPFDKYIRGESTDLPKEVKDGFNLFAGKAACATCHFMPTFAGLVPPFYNENESEILGVLANPRDPKSRLDEDKGRMNNDVRAEWAWIYERSVKTTTVRNAGLTAPYFHNGAYTTLEEVIDFYNQGGGQGMGHTVTNQTLPPDALNLTDYEKKALIAFINALTDTASAGY